MVVLRHRLGCALRCCLCSRVAVLLRSQAKQVWKTLEHHAVTFPPAYVPHGVKLLYDSKPVDLSPEEEEVRLPLLALRIKR